MKNDFAFDFEVWIANHKDLWKNPQKDFSDH